MRMKQVLSGPPFSSFVAPLALGAILSHQSYSLCRSDACLLFGGLFRLLRLVEQSILKGRIYKHLFDADLFRLLDAFDSSLNDVGNL
jgi:hypothetical protein